MPRAPSESNRCLSLLAYYDTRFYPEHSPEPAWDLILLAYARGPIRESVRPNVYTKKTTELCSTEMLELRSKKLLSAEQRAHIDEQIDEGRSVQFDVVFSFFESDWTCTHDFQDLSCAGVARIGLRESLHLSAEVDFIDGWPFDFAMDYFAKQAEPESITHCEHRMWQLLAYVSPKLHEQVKLVTARQRNRTIYPHLDMLATPFNGWKLCAPGPYPASDVRNRDHILACLAHDDFVFNRMQLQIILAEDKITEWDQAQQCHPRILAKDSTVNKLIAGCGIPNIGGKYTALDIRGILIPYAMHRPRARARYHDLRDELIDVGAYVPDQPTVQ